MARLIVKMGHQCHLMQQTLWLSPVSVLNSHLYQSITWVTQCHMKNSICPYCKEQILLLKCCITGEVLLFYYSVLE